MSSVGQLANASVGTSCATAVPTAPTGQMRRAAETSVPLGASGAGGVAAAAGACLERRAVTANGTVLAARTRSTVGMSTVLVSTGKRAGFKSQPADTAE